MANVVDILSRVRAAEPRIDSLPEYSRIAVAGMLLAGMTFEEASASFTETLATATKEVKAQRETQKATREKTLAEFEKAVFQTVFDSAAAINSDARPKGGLVLTVFYDEPLKNEDGSPATNEDGSPKTGIGVHASAKWTVRSTSDSAPASNGNLSNRGRVGKVLLNGTEFKSLAEAAKSVNVATDGQVRANLTAAGFTVSEKQTDAAGKSFISISRNGATAPVESPAAA